MPPVRYSQDRSPAVVGAGFFALDVLVDAQRSYQALGGSAGNVLAILGYFGWNTMPVAELGRDSAAELIRTEFVALGAETSFLRCSSDVRTPVVYQHIREGRPSYSLSCPICGHRGSPHGHSSGVLAQEVVEHSPSPAVFFFDRANALNATLAEHFRSHGAMVVFEPSRASDDSYFKRCVELSSVVKYASDRIDSLDVDGDFLEVRTLGAEGLSYRMPDSTQWVEMPAIPAPFVADSSGSGDWCTAGAIHWILDRKASHQPLGHAEVQAAFRFGQALASLNCRHQGARTLARNVSSEHLLGFANWLSSSGTSDAVALQAASASKWEPCLEENSSSWEARLASLCCQQLSS